MGGKDESEIGFDNSSGRKLIEISKDFFRPAEVDLLVGDYSKINEKLGWKPEYNLTDLVKKMCSEEGEDKRIFKINV